jgi:hypothetical protein
MNWDQIENKWALMTRRIRADWRDDRPESAVESASTSLGRDGLVATIADNQNAAVMQTEFKTSAK